MESHEPFLFFARVARTRFPVARPAPGSMRLLVVGRQPGPPTPGCIRSLVPQEPPATDAGAAASALLAYAAPGAVVVARLGWH